MKKHREFRIILAGFGTVGKGVAELLMKKASFFEHHGFLPKVVGIITSQGGVFREEGIDLSVALSDLSRAGDVERGESHLLIAKMDADILIEMSPTILEGDGGAGMKNIVAAFRSGKHVITSNKGPLALNFSRVVEEAQAHNCLLRYEATVCAAIPLFSAYRHALAANKIQSIRGILNGTTNYILTKMHTDNVPFSLALAEAIDAGYAESNYLYDVEGHDAAAKAAILANALLELPLSYRDVSMTGIQHVLPSAIQQAKDNGFVIKLIATISRDEVSVSPRLIPQLHPLNVSGTLNAVHFSMDMANDLYLIGRGAGKFETAGAIINDLYDVMWHGKHCD